MTSRIQFSWINCISGNNEFKTAIQKYKTNDHEWPLKWFFASNVPLAEKDIKHEIKSPMRAQICLVDKNFFNSSNSARCRLSNILLICESFETTETDMAFNMDMLHKGWIQYRWRKCHIICLLRAWIVVLWSLMIEFNSSIFESFTPRSRWFLLNTSIYDLNDLMLGS